MNERILLHVVASLLVTALILFGVHSGRIERYFASRSSKKSKPRRPTSRAFPTPWWIWVVFLGGSLFVGVFLVPTNKPGNLVPEPGENVVWSIATCFIPLLLLGLFAFGRAFIKLYDPVSFRAIKRAKEGDLDGALTELQAEVETRRPRAVRMSGLGYLYYQKKEFEQSLHYFIEAEKLDRRQPLYRVCQADSLIELGRHLEAEQILRDVCERHPQELIPRCGYCLVLADLGKWDEATRQLQLADELPKAYIPSADLRKIRADLLQKCRDRLADVVSKPSLDHPDDLI